jgi:hypothetical protein
MKGLPYLVSLLVGGCIPREQMPPPLAAHPAELSADAAYLARLCKDGPSGRSSQRAMVDRSCKEQKKETSAQYLARMCEDAAEDVRGGGEFEWEEWNCEQLNPELGRKLKAEHETFLKDHPIRHYYGSGLAPVIVIHDQAPADPYAEAKKAQEQFSRDEQIRSDQELLDYEMRQRTLRAADEIDAQQRSTPALMPSPSTDAPVNLVPPPPAPNPVGTSDNLYSPPAPKTWGETPYAPMIPPVMRDQPVENVNPMIPPAARGLP